MDQILGIRIQKVALLATTLFVLALGGVKASADEGQTYLLVPKTDSDVGISFSVPYTAGIHTGRAMAAEGSINVSSEGKIQQGKFTVPLAAMTTDNPKRDCHLREAMGLDYTLARYPKEHICASENVLPATGPDSIAYPNIEFQITKFEEVSNVDGVINGTVTGVWSMHGVTLPFTAPIVATQNAKGATVKSRFTLSLAAYGIFVKPVLIITVKDTVTVNLDLVLQKK